MNVTQRRFLPLLFLHHAEMVILSSDTIRACLVLSPSYEQEMLKQICLWCAPRGTGVKFKITEIFAVKFGNSNKSLSDKYLWIFINDQKIEVSVSSAALYSLGKSQHHQMYHSRNSKCRYKKDMIVGWHKKKLDLHNVSLKM